MAANRVVIEGACVARLAAAGLGAAAVFAMMPGCDETVVARTAPPLEAVSAPTAALAPSSSPSASPPPPPPAPPSVDAEKCFADPLCDPALAAQALVAEDTAGEPVACARFLYGIGVPADAARARACLEREVAREGKCDGGSPSMERTFLATMLADAQGGPRDTGRASDLFDGCFEDVTVQSLRQQATQRAHGSGKPLDFCKDIGGTTLSMQGCLSLDLERSIAERQVIAWPIVAALDARGRRAWAEATEAWSTAARAVAELDGDAFRGGSMSGGVFVSSESEQERERTRRIATWSSYRPDPDASPRAAEAEMARALARRLAGARDAQEKGLVEASQTAWLAYRDREVTLYGVLFGARLGPAAVERDARASLARARAAALRKKVSP